MIQFRKTIAHRDIIKYEQTCIGVKFWILNPSHYIQCRKIYSQPSIGLFEPIQYPYMQNAQLVVLDHNNP